MEEKEKEANDDLDPWLSVEPALTCDTFMRALRRVQQLLGITNPVPCLVVIVQQIVPIISTDIPVPY